MAAKQIATAVMDLPVLGYRQEIMAAVAGNAVTIVTAETGAGKSTQVPRFLAEAGYRVICTQPRRLAARTLAQRVAEEIKTRLGDRVGYRTAEERADSAVTEVLFVTDGLQLVRELAGQGGTGRKTVLVLDEVHEWNLNIEVLVAWARQRVAAGDDLRVILMSATLDAPRLAAFYGESTPVISVPGRLFPVERREAASRALVDECVALAKAGRNVLVFQPGKREIAECVSAIERELGGSAVVLPLHGGLEPAEQQRAFAPPPFGKVKVVVATNVAQTSVTIPDIDAVCDSGVERRVELADGIEGLYLRPVSQADCEQRAGRAGRCKPGVYVLCSDAHLSERPSFPTAEVLRSRLDQMVLRLAVQGFDATALRFFHQPDARQLEGARKSLLALGAMTADGRVTTIGRKMAKLPVSVQFARMLVEAEGRGVLEQVATIAACLEAGDIRAKAASKYEAPAWKSLTQESRSDLLVLLDVFNAGRTMKGNGGSKADALRNAGLFVKDFFRAEEIRRKLLDAVGGRLRSESRKFASREEERSAILRACVAGMVDHLYSQEYGRSYRNGGAGTRDLARESVISDEPKWLVGLPKDIEITDRRGRKLVLNLVTMASAVDPVWLTEVAPQLAEEKTGLAPRYDAQKDVVVSTTETFFNGQKVRSEEVADGEHPEAAAVFARWLASQSALSSTPAHAAGISLDAVVRANAARQKRAAELNTRAGEEMFKVFSSDEILERFAKALSGAKAIVEVVGPEALALPALDEEMVASVVRKNPDTINVLGSELVVEYKDSYGSRRAMPRVKLSDEFVAAYKWRELPDKGVRLPGGRVVEVVVPIGYYDTIASANIPELKVKVSNHLNQKLWDGWADRPTIALPDPADEASTVPEIIEVAYGASVVDGSELIAFGVVAVNSSRYYSADPWFTGKWHQSREEAVKARGAACLKLEEVRKEAQEQKALAEAKSEAELAKAQIHEMCTRKGYYEVDAELRRQAEERRYAYLPSGVAELLQWTAETKALVAKVDADIAEVERRKEEEARVQAEAEARRQSTEIAIRELGWAKAHLLVTEQEILVACAESGQVNPAMGEARYAEFGLDSRGRGTAWWPVKAGESVTIREFSWKGNLKREDRIKTVPSWLKPGVWAVGDDQQGEFFYPVIHYRDGREVIPEVVEVIRRAPKPATAPATPPQDSKPVDLSKVDLGALFGGNASTRRK